MKFSIFPEVETSFHYRADNFPRSRNFVSLQGRQFSILFLIVFLVLLFFPLLAQALDYPIVPCGQKKDDPESNYNETVPCQLCHLFVLFKNIMDFLLFTLVPPLAILMIVIAGAMYMLAYIEAIGNPEWIKKAKDLLWSIFWGAVIIYGAWLIVDLFFMVIGIQTWTGLEKGWWKINCP